MKKLNTIKWFFLSSFLHRIVDLFPRNDFLSDFLVHSRFPKVDEHRMKFAAQYIQDFRNYNPVKDFSKAHFYSFGAGWDLMVPLCLYFTGIKNQLLTDIHANFNPRKVTQTIDKLSRKKEYFNQLSSLRINAKNPGKIKSINDLKVKTGIQYLAPFSTANTRFKKNTFDFIYNTAVLEHVPAPDIVSIIKECFRILKPGGTMSCMIDLTDHRSYIDSSVPWCDFLKFSPELWRYLNSPLFYQNRLRYPNYIKLFEKAGFKIVNEQVTWLSREEKKELKNMTVFETFKSFDPRFLEVKTLHITLQKLPV